MKDGSFNNSLASFVDLLVIASFALFVAYRFYLPAA